MSKKKTLTPFTKDEVDALLERPQWAEAKMGDVRSAIRIIRVGSHTIIAELKPGLYTSGGQSRKWAGPDRGATKSYFKALAKLGAFTKEEVKRYELYQAERTAKTDRIDAAEEIARGCERLKIKVPAEAARILESRPKQFSFRRV